MRDAETFRPGLEGVVVAESALSWVDGEGGRLVVRGHPIEELAPLGFEAVCGLLWDGRLPDALRAEALRRGLAAGRVAAFASLARVAAVLEAGDAMDALRAAVAALPSAGEDAEATRFRLAGALAVYAAAWHRRRAGHAPLAPDPARAHADDLLRMLRGRPAAPARARGLAASLVTVAAHGMNASTFTARVVASPRADAVSAVVAALGALRGPLHGGAPGPVLDMLDAIGRPDHAERWLLDELAAGRRIMGMGHRVYRVRDPRAAVLEEAARPLSSDRLALARAVEAAASKILRERKPDRPLAANVEFYTAVLLDAVGVPRTLFSPMFAGSRVVGWCAHVAEQRAVGRLIRPGSIYVGARPG